VAAGEPSGTWDLEALCSHLQIQLARIEELNAQRAAELQRQLDQRVTAVFDQITARIDGIDRATALLSETVNRTPTQIQTEISHVRQLMDEQFKSVTLQFIERDVRTGQAATASAQALAAALQAAKEAVFEQAQAAAKASDKTELSTSKQIDLIQTQIKALGDTFGDRLSELKERIDRGEGSDAGASGSRTEQRLNVSQVVAVVAVLVAVGTLLLLAFHK
jgi:hypothetical protein